MSGQIEQVSSETTVQYQWVLVTLIIVVCAFFAFLYMRYTASKRQREQAEEAVFIQEGNLRLQQDFFRADGSMNPAPFVFKDDSTENEGAVNSRAQGDHRQSENDAGKKTNKTSSSDAKTKDGDDSDTDSEGDEQDEQENKGGIVSQVVDSLKSGKLLRTINRFSVRTNQISKRLADRKSDEEKEESEKLNRLADEAVNPLFERRIAKLQKEQAEKEQLQLNVARRHAGAISLLASAQNSVPSKDNSQCEEVADSDEDTPDKGGDNVDRTPKQPSGIYNFNEKQLELLSNAMASVAADPVSAIVET